MGVKNKRPDLNGVLVVDKPLGVTSAHVCRVVRRITGGAKVGHAGTLDPLATGVLVLCLGKATKGIDTIQAGEKWYEALVDLSVFTTTDDAEGERTPPSQLADPLPTREQIQAVLDEQFTGSVQQAPPAFSAVKVDGQRAYKRARSGEDVEIKPKTVRIDEVRVNHYDWPELELFIRCGKGTYIRSIARDLGVALQTGGSLLNLRRTRVGEYTIEDSRSLEKLEQGIQAEDLLPAPTPPDSVNDEAVSD